MLNKIISLAVSTLTLIAGILWIAYVGYQPGPNYGVSIQQWLPTVGLLLVGLLPLISAVIALRHPKVAALILVCPIPILGLWFALATPVQLTQIPAAWSDADPTSVALTFCLFIVPSLFWLVVSRLTWPPALSIPLTWIQAIVITSIVFFSVIVASAVMDLHANDWVECHYSIYPFTKQLSPRQAVFTARIYKAGLIWPSRSIARQYPGSPKKYWALAIVDRQFWGLPWWQRKIVLITLQTNADDPLDLGETYFIDGRHKPGVLTRFLPIFRIFCTRTSRLKDAEVDLRVIRDGPPKNGIRILGRTIRWRGDGSFEVVPNTTVVIGGPAGKTLVTSDQQGIYDVSGLPPGRYDVGLQTINGGVYWEHPDCVASIRDAPGQTGDVRDCTIFVR